MQNDHAGLIACLKEIDLPFTHSSCYERSLQWDKVNKKKDADIDKLLDAWETDLIIQENFLG